LGEIPCPMAISMYDLSVPTIADAGRRRRVSRKRRLRPHCSECNVKPARVVEHRLLRTMGRSASRSGRWRHHSAGCDGGPLKTGVFNPPGRRGGHSINAGLQKLGSETEKQVEALKPEALFFFFFFFSCERTRKQGGGDGLFSSARPKNPFVAGKHFLLSFSFTELPFPRHSPPTTSCAPAGVAARQARTIWDGCGSKLMSGGMFSLPNEGPTNQPPGARQKCQDTI